MVNIVFDLIDKNWHQLLKKLFLNLKYILLYKVRILQIGFLLGMGVGIDIWKFCHKVRGCIYSPERGSKCFLPLPLSEHEMHALDSKSNREPSKFSKVKNQIKEYPSKRVNKFLIVIHFLIWFPLLNYPKY